MFGQSPHILFFFSDIAYSFWKAPSKFNYFPLKQKANVLLSLTTKDFSKSFESSNQARLPNLKEIIYISFVMWQLKWSTWSTDVRHRTSLGYLLWKAPSKFKTLCQLILLFKRKITLNSYQLRIPGNLLNVLVEHISKYIFLIYTYFNICFCKVTVFSIQSKTHPITNAESTISNV